MSQGFEFVLCGSRGGPVRTKLLTELDDSPRSTDQLVARLDRPEETVRHHLDVLDENDLVTRSGDAGGAYRLTDEGGELLHELE